MHGGMKTIMKLEDLMTIDQLEDFLSGTQTVAFSVISDKDACYHWIQGELVKFRYLRLSRQGKGVVIRYLMKISGNSPKCDLHNLHTIQCGAYGILFLSVFSYLLIDTCCCC